jgi:von Willebrand factor A domain-containing protein 8
LPKHGNTDAWLLDDWFVIAITDANFGRYEISLEDLKRVMNRVPKVNTALICIGDGAEATWIPKNFPGRGFRVGNASELPVVLKSILERVADK